MNKQQRIDYWREKARQRPFAIGHRGARGHALENTLEAFRIASVLGCAMWELDVHTTQDGEVVVSHDATLMTMAGVEVEIATSSWEELSTIRLKNGEYLARFEQVIALAQALNTGLYIELKCSQVALRVVDLLRAARFDHAVIGSFESAWLLPLRQCEFPLSILVRGECDPFQAAAGCGADMIHLCWERVSERPDQLLTHGLLSRAHCLGLPIVVWHEERPEVIEALLRKPVLGICSDLPERVVNSGV